MKNPHLKFIALSIFSATTALAFGAGKFTVQTDGSGNFIATPLGTAAWSGNGTVTNNLNGLGNPSTIVSGTSGGTFSPGNFALTANDPATFINGDKINSGIALDITMVATGAGASFDFGGRSLNDGSWQNFQITNMVNVETLTVTYTFSDPIASIRGDGSNAPFLVGMRRAAGAGTYSATGTIENLTVDGIPYNISMLSGGGGFVDLGSAVWNETSGIGTISGASTSATFNAFTRLDINGGGVITPTLISVNDDIVQEIERTYATGMTWTITNDGAGAFASGSEFYFSFNGVQYDDTYSTVIPEPSSMLLSMLGLGLAIGRRKRT